MKTATINVYHVFGTKRAVCGVVYYRGKELYRKIDNLSPQAVLNLCQAWARNNGFTHIKAIYG